jgi:hypothetical protein
MTRAARRRVRSRSPWFGILGGDSMEEGWVAMGRIGFLPPSIPFLFFLLLPLTIHKVDTQNLP